MIKRTRSPTTYSDQSATKRGASLLGRDQPIASMTLQWVNGPVGRLRVIVKGVSEGNHRLRNLSREGGWIIFGQALSVGGALTLVRVLTEHLTPGEYGRLALALTISTLAGQVFLGGISNASGRFYSVAIERGDIEGFFKATLLYAMLAASAVVVLSITPLFTLFRAGADDWGWLVFVVLLYSIVSAFGSAVGAIQNAARRRSIVASHSAIDAWTKVLMAFVAVRLLGASSTNVGIGFLLTALIVYFSQLYFFKPVLSMKSRKQDSMRSYAWLSEMWSYSWPFSVWGIFTGLQQVSDRWALQTFATASDVGLYTAVYQLGYTPISLIVGLVMTSISPVLFERAGDGKDNERNAQIHRLVKQILKFGLMTTFLGFTASWLWHARLFEWMVSESYRDASIYMPWLILSGGLFANGQIISMQLMSEMRSGDLLSVKVGTALLGVLLNILGARHFGMTGVVAGSLIFSFTYFVAVYAIARQGPGSCRLCCD